jgi:hypothetical protein
MSLHDAIDCDYPGCDNIAKVRVERDRGGDLTMVALPQGWEKIPAKNLEYDRYMDKHVCWMHSHDRCKAEILNE